MAFVGGLYLLTGLAGLQLSATAGHVTLFWAPTGIALAAFMLLGRRAALAVAPAAFLVSVLQGGAATTALAIAVGNTAAPWLASRPLRHGVDGDWFEAPANVVRFVGVIVVAMGVSACVGTAALVLEGVVPRQAAAYAAMKWWAGDALGAVLVGRATLAAVAEWQLGEFPWRRLGGALAATLLFLVPAFVWLQPALPWCVIALVPCGVVVTLCDRATGGLTLVAAFFVTAYGTALGRGPVAALGVPEGAAMVAACFSVLALHYLLVGAAFTERRRQSRALLESQQRFQGLMEAAPDAIFVVAQDGTVLEANDNACRSLGVTRDALRGMNVEDFAVDYQPGGVEALFESWAEGEPIIIHSRHRHSDGHTFPVEISASYMVVDGRPCMLGSARDVSARHAMEHKLVEQQSRLQTIFDREPECVKLLDPASTLLDMNPAGLRMIAAESIEQVRGLNTLDLVAPEFRERFQEGVDAVFRGENTFQVFEIIALDGTRHWMEQHSAPIHDPNDPSKVQEMLAVTRDITERRAREADMRRKHRLEAIGELAGGIAHDLNNVLAPMVLATDELLELNEKDGEALELVETIDAGLMRAAKMLRQVLTYARGLEGKRRDVTPRDVVEEVTTMLEPTLPKSVALHVDIEPDLEPIAADATQLHQVILNLCLNARDAMPRGGRLRVTVRAVEVIRPDGVGAEDCRPGDYVCFAVADEGSGIPEAERERIFEPFFTTKGPEEGTGLGLASVLGIVRGHRGFIRVSSEAGQGTCFEVHIPVGRKLRRTTPAPVSAVRRFDAGGRRVLFVDDEAAVRRAVALTLERQGFSVITAESGEGALEILRRDEHDIDILLSDLDMPGMSGIELVAQVRSMHPRLPAVITTGRLDEASERAIKNVKRVGVLPKPFSPGTLRHALAFAVEQAA